MLFNSLHFLVFFPAVVALYFATPFRFRWVLLLAASYYFYASWEPVYLGLIVLSTLVDYVVALRMGALPSGRKRRPYLLVSILANLGMLGTFKYLGFVTDSFRVLSGQLGIFQDFAAFDLLLPVGISFYTFQTLGYSIDVYRGKKEPERHLGIFALYVSFFPQLVAGPIERAGRLLPQLHQRHTFDYHRVTSGLQRMMWGFFKKVVIADQLALYVDPVYASPESYPGQVVILATYLFAFQIFCDFSGYTDIAIGAARVFGYDLMENFQRPFFAASIQDFWRRWHISLSTWLRDYLYIPLGGSRVSKGRSYFNLFLVFLLAGLWHGAGWNFVVWGGLHGMYLIVSVATQDVRDRLWEGLHGMTAAVAWINSQRVRHLVAVVSTFHLFVFSLMVFRAGPLSHAFVVITEALQVDFSTSGPPSPLAGGRLVVVLGAIVFLEVVHLVQRRVDIAQVFSTMPGWARWSVYYVGVFAILLFGEFGGREFYYFQF